MTTFDYPIGLIKPDGHGCCRPSSHLRPTIDIGLQLQVPREAVNLASSLPKYRLAVGQRQDMISYELYLSDSYVTGKTDSSGRLMIRHPGRFHIFRRRFDR